MNQEEEREYRIVVVEVIYWKVRVFPAIDIPKINFEEQTMRKCNENVEELIVSMCYIVAETGEDKKK